MPSQSRPALPLALAAATLPALAVSYAGAYDRFTWWLEAFPVLVGLPVLALTWRRHPLSGFLYGLAFVHALILLAGAHYTYARVPLGEWMRDWFGFSRNDYDKIGHFAQGLVPALLAREVLIRFSPFAAAPHSRFVPLLSLCAAMAVSALYEIIEWLTAVATGTAADSFLGTQGYAWDTQSDMAFALAGAATGLALLSRLQDASIARLGSRGPP